MTTLHCVRFCSRSFYNIVVYRRKTKQIIRHYYKTVNYILILEDKNLKSYNLFMSRKKKFNFTRIQILNACERTEIDADIC